MNCQYWGEASAHWWKNPGRTCFDLLPCGTGIRKVRVGLGPALRDDLSSFSDLRFLRVYQRHLYQVFTQEPCL